MSSANSLAARHVFGGMLSADPMNPFANEEDHNVDIHGEDLNTTEMDDLTGVMGQHEDGNEFVLTRSQRHGTRGPVEMLRFDRVSKLLRIFPQKGQFKHIEELQLEIPNWDADNHSVESERSGLLYVRGLPKGFSATYEYLGIARDYRGLFVGIEDSSQCKIIRFVTSGEEGLEEIDRVFKISLGRFEAYRSAVDLTRNRARTAARRVIEARSHNSIADLLDLPQVQPKRARNEAIRLFTEEADTGHVIDAADRSLLADEMTAVAPVIARESPQRLVQLREDIELVSLEALIDRFETDLEGPYSKNEDHWQAFFEANRFALQLIFATPIIVEIPHATVQVSDAYGRGSRITDFLCINSVTRTSLLVEIKTPGTQLMSRTPYRGKGTASVYAPHADLSGPVAQVQSQMAAVPRDMAPNLYKSPGLDLDAWNDPRGAVISGRISTLDPEQHESFLRYRAELSTVTILAYDEVLERLKGLRAALSS